MALLIKILILLINFVFIVFNDLLELYSFKEIVIYLCIINYISIILFDALKSKTISPYLLFQIPFGLFIIGRIIGWALDDNLNPNIINYFYNVNLTDKQLVFYLLLSMLFYNSCSLGYEISIHRKIKPLPITLPTLNSSVIKGFILIAVTVFVPLIIVEITKTIKLVLEQGYSAMYLDKKENVGNVFSMGMNILCICLGLTMLDNNYKKLTFILMVILFTICLTLLFMGSRGPIMTYILLYFWVYKRHKNIMKISIYGLSILLIVQLLNSYVRTVGNYDNLIAKFIYDQGTTFIILPFIEYINEWPTVGLLQNFIPGISRFTSLFYDYPTYEANLANFMGYHLNPELHNLGNGLGWTVIADAYIYSGKFTPLFSLYSIVFGFILGLFSISAKNNKFSLALITTLTLQLSFLYRSGLFAIIPLMIYFLIIYFLLSLISHPLKQKL
ncbi:TPA: O-antigen polysaccharide polymerase Wzy [Providencia stuartii]|nr:O-antigen polysaccharide polymerase Wzy [Providencia stuartii]